MKIYNSESLELIENLLNIGIALSAEKDHNKLLELILTEARKVTNADAGTLFLYQEEELVFKLIQNDTLDINRGGEGEQIDLPSVELNKDNASAYAALTKQTVNIADVYNSERFDFSGPKEYDRLTGYHTQSMLAIPLVDHREDIMGVLQLINAQDEQSGAIIPFAPELEKVAVSLASQAAVSLSNVQAREEIEELLHSFVEVMATAIDARTPYNIRHTRRIALMIKKITTCINELEEGKYAAEQFDKSRTQQLVMAAWLHDIGKIAVPLALINKSTRLESKLELILQRFDYIATRIKLEYYQNEQDSKQQLENKLSIVDRARRIVKKANKAATFVDRKLIANLQKIGELTYTDEAGIQQPWLTEEELKFLSVAKGTLTDREREEMEKHVQVAVRILEAIPFPDRLAKVTDWVAMHHEFLDGSGYPAGLEGKEIPLEPRILTTVDIFDALTAADRPYKKAKTVAEALEILDNMVAEGKLDQEVVRIFREEEIWKIDNQEGNYYFW